MGVFTDQVQVLGSEAKQARRKREQKEQEQALLYELETKLKNKFNIYLQNKKIEVGDYTYLSDKREKIFLQLLNFDIKAAILDTILLNVKNNKINRYKLYNILDDKYFTILNKTKQSYILIEQANERFRKEREKEEEKARKEAEKLQKEREKLEKEHARELAKQEQQRQKQKSSTGLYLLAACLGIGSGFVSRCYEIRGNRKNKKKVLSLLFLCLYIYIILSKKAVIIEYNRFYCMFVYINTSLNVWNSILRRFYCLGISYIPLYFKCLKINPDKSVIHLFFKY